MSHPTDNTDIAHNHEDKEIQPQGACPACDRVHHFFAPTFERKTVGD